jgi:hypothetical protein
MLNSTLHDIINLDVLEKDTVLCPICLESIVSSGSWSEAAKRTTVIEKCSQRVHRDR